MPNLQVTSNLGGYRGTSLIRNSPSLQEPHMALGMGLLYGPKGGCFLMCEVPLYLQVMSPLGG